MVIHASVNAERFAEPLLGPMQPLPCSFNGGSQLIRELFGRHIPLTPNHVDDFSVAILESIANQTFLDALDLRQDMFLVFELLNIAALVFRFCKLRVKEPLNAAGLSRFPSVLVNDLVTDGSERVGDSFFRVLQHCELVSIHQS